jgi:hypothetical protein
MDMSQLALNLLGPPRVEIDVHEIRISRRKALALLAYLAMERSSRSAGASASVRSAGASASVRSAGASASVRSADVPMSVHTRDALATLFWPEQDQSRARLDAVELGGTGTDPLDQLSPSPGGIP